MFEKDEMLKLADTVAAWILFQKRCKRGSLLLERLLCLPIAEFAQAHAWHVKVEEPYPGVLNQTGPKFPIDYAFKSKEGGRIRGCIEAKLNNDNIWSAVVRSALLPQYGKRFVLIAWTNATRDVKRARKYLEPAFKFEPGKVRIEENEEMRKQWGDFSHAVDEWFRKLEAPPSKMPTVWTELVGEYGLGGGDVAVAIWKISCRGIPGTQ